MPSKTKKAQKSIASDASLDKKDEHVPSETKGKLGSSGMSGKSHSKLKTPCSIRTTEESRKREENLDKKEKHVSSENKGGLGKGRSGGEGDCNVKSLSKGNRKYESGKSKGSLNRKGECVSSKNVGRLGTSSSYGEGDPNLKMPSKIKKTHKSMESNRSLDKKVKHVSSEIKGKLCSSRVNGTGHSKMKMPCLLKKTQVSGMRKGNLDKKDEHVSSENKGKLGNSRSGGESDCNVKTLSKRNKRCESRKNVLDRKEEHVSLKNEADPNMKALSKRKKQCRSRKKNQSLDKKDEHDSLENDDKVCGDGSHGEGGPNLEMPSTIKSTHEPIESDGNLNKKVEHVASEIGGKLGTKRINNDRSRSKVKVLCRIKKTHESKKRSENLDKMDRHVSSKNEGRLGKSRTGGDEGDFNLKTPSKRKEKCKSGKSNGEHHVLSENAGRLGNSGGNDDVWMNLKRPVGAGTPGSWIGKLFVSNTEITKGSNSTIVLEGFYEGRSVAVKRLLLAHHDVGSQIIGSLIASDGDKNIVRLYGAECDQDFVYLALERCACSLYDLIRACSKSSEKSVFPQDPASNAMQMNLVEGTMQDVNLWREDGHPSPLLLKLMREVVSGLAHLHHSGVIPRDLKPQNVLIILSTKELCPKLSDMEHVSLKNEGRLGNHRSNNEADPNMKAISKRKKRCRSRKKNQSLDKKDEHGSLENDGRVCDDRRHGEGGPNLEMPSTMKNTHEPIESDGNPNKKEEHFSSEIGGKLGTNRINDESRSKVKMLCKIKKTHECGKRSENLDKMNGHVSSKNEGRLSKSRTGDEGDFNSKTPSKRKEKCESGKSKGEHHVLSENAGRLGNSVGNDDVWMNLRKAVGAGTPGRRIGKLFVSDTEIMKGSNGTIVLEGFYEGRSVAVKQLLLAHHDIASQEIKSLIASDGDKYIVRLYGAECDQDFVYLALERCACSLYDLIQACSKSSEKSVFPQDPASNAMQLNLVEGTMQDVNLWREDGHPSPLLLKLMREVVSGLVHLHHSGVIHRDLKPQNVLITKELCPKLSDMGISRLLPRDTSSSDYHASDYGRSGSQASEPLLAQQTGSVDVFDLGCVLFFCITGGRHPFGYTPKGDDVMEENTVDLSPVEFIPEAADLLAHLLNSDPNLRPNALEVLHHPLFWDSKTRLSFLRDISDWLKSKAWGSNSDLPENLESIAQYVFKEEWNEKIECEYMKHMRRFRAYEFKRVEDLLRIVRNTFSHRRELPPEIQEIVGSSPEDLDSYFAERFPRLFIETYRFVSMCCKYKEPTPFPDYFNW